MAKDGKLLYHLTALENLESILKNGLIPRAELDVTNFEDVADNEILSSRKQHDLDQYVPFHFFAKNPFDYGVQRAYPEKDFVLLTVRRTVALGNNWKVVPRHPLAGEGYELLDYEIGMNTIDWAKMNSPRDYQNDRECKVVCMAECLSPDIVSSKKIHCIYTKTDVVKTRVQDLVKRNGIDCFVDLSPRMFAGTVDV